MLPREMRREDFEAHMYHYRAETLSVVDGDTVRFRLDLGDSTYRKRSVRLLGVNAPEVVGETREAGLAAKEYLERLLPPGTLVFVRTHKDRTTFERLLGEVFVAGQDGELKSVGEALIEAGHAERSVG